MPTVQRTVSTTTPPSRALPYLLDFENAVEWDSGTVSCELLSGDGGPGTVWHNVSKFAGRTVDLDYTLESVGDNGFVIVGRNETTTSRDTITVTPEGSGSSVDYRAEFSFTGLGRWLWPLAMPLLNKLGNDTAKTLKSALDRL
ncbi:Polyketide cyclase / dehydrase and lipid transport [Pedococcus dokdonensis]|uniref:Polyketide cyclase / dehydrase and lipid transport n=1 Tax=Pedococcus dokdonensis TaxID=443156 RepID=A0A1H0KWR3_9MICO|nr:SRPBCC family protein [Pedococcus dokdonensis]SDO60369.1 Polyketide cyclase / dehydrase and lipid transport [Pedococcus dokdonensis]